MITDQSIACWLCHDLLDILDLIAPEDQDWIDEAFSEDANKEITKAIHCRT